MAVLNDESGMKFAIRNSETGEDVKLAMEQLWLTGRVLPVGARLVLRHVFKSAEKKPLELVYTYGLPRDATLRSFRVVGEGFTVESELKPTAEARKEYEEAIQSGHLAVMNRVYHDGLSSLTVGNVRPGERVAVYLEILAGVEHHDNGFRFRFPFTLAPSYHSLGALPSRPRATEKWSFPRTATTTCSSPRGRATPVNFIRSVLTSMSNFPATAAKWLRHPTCLRSRWGRTRPRTCVWPTWRMCPTGTWCLT